MMFTLLLALLVTVLFQDLFVLFRFRASVDSPGSARLPAVSILLAVRNEEDNIQRCLDALLVQELENYEILIGDDQSDDQTAPIILRMAREHAHIKYWKVPGKYKGLKGKARVLAWLAERANGELFLITDADTAPQPGWAHTLSGVLTNRDADLVNGVTRLQGDAWFAKFQDAEWVMAEGMLSVLAATGNPQTAIGNNMGITRAAYEAVGGFQSIPFSLTEDYALFKAASDQGFRLRHVFSRNSLAISTPVKSAAEYLSQRSRWMHGAARVHFLIKSAMILQVLYLPLTAAMMFISLPAGLILLSCRLMLRMAQLHRFNRATSTRLNPLHMVWIEPVYSVMNIAVFIHYSLVRSVTWKGRTYSPGTPVGQSNQI